MFKQLRAFMTLSPMVLQNLITTLESTLGYLVNGKASNLLVREVAYINDVNRWDVWQFLQKKNAKCLGGTLNNGSIITVPSNTHQALTLII